MQFPSIKTKVFKKHAKFPFKDDSKKKFKSGNRNFQSEFYDLNRKLNFIKCPHLVYTFLTCGEHSGCDIDVQNTKSKLIKYWGGA